MSVMARFGLVVVAATGCNQAFELQPTALQDATVDVNCATVTPDEDGDCVADDADNCPGVVNTDQFDLDHDGVGEACDPRPGIEGDTILEFDSFNDPAASMQRWRDIEQNMPDQWMFASGYARHSQIGDSFSTLQSAAAFDHDDLTVEVGFDLVDWDATKYPKISLITDAKVNDTNGSNCYLEDDDASASTTAVAIYMQDYDLSLPDPNSGQATLTRFFPPSARPLPLMLTFRRSTPDAELDCELRYGFRRAAPGTIVKGPTSVWPQDRYVSIWLRYAAIDIKWITVYTVR